jgi:hypothetical protein
VNAVAPGARTRLTFVDNAAHGGDGADGILSPRSVSPLLVWLGSAQNTGAPWAVEEVGAVVDRLIAEAPKPHPVLGTPGSAERPG